MKDMGWSVCNDKQPSIHVISLHNNWICGRGHVFFSPLAYAVTFHTYIHNAQVTVGSTDLSANKDIRQQIEVAEDYQKYGLISRVLKEHNNGGKILVFVETKKGCDHLCRSLKQDGWNAQGIHGDKSQSVSSWCLFFLIAITYLLLLFVSLGAIFLLSISDSQHRPLF